MTLLMTACFVGTPPNGPTAAAIIDHLLHYSTTVNIRGESYRLRDKKRAGVFSIPTSTLAAPAPQVGNLRPALRRNRS